MYKRQAFAIVDGENHASVALKDRGPKNPHTLELIRAALEVEDADYRSSGASFPWQRRIDQLDPGIERRSPRYLNPVSYTHLEGEGDAAEGSCHCGCPLSIRARQAARPLKTLAQARKRSASRTQ